VRVIHWHRLALHAKDISLFLPPPPVAFPLCYNGHPPSSLCYPPLSHSPRCLCILSALQPLFFSILFQATTLAFSPTRRLPPRPRCARRTHLPEDARPPQRAHPQVWPHFTRRRCVRLFHAMPTLSKLTDAPHQVSSVRGSMAPLHHMYVPLRSVAIWMLEVQCLRPTFGARRRARQLAHLSSLINL
jgi:hypothetical protein